MSFSGRVRTRFSTIEAVEEEVFAADVVIGAVLVPGASAPKLVTRAMLKSMQRGAVLVDVAIDQGGCFETSHATTHADPTYEVDGVVHYCVANMPGAVPVTSSQALNNATLPFGLALANKGFAAVLEDPHLRNGLNVHRGRITNKARGGEPRAGVCPGWEAASRAAQCGGGCRARPRCVSGFLMRSTSMSMRSRPRTVRR